MDNPFYTDVRAEIDSRGNAVKVATLTDRCAFVFLDPAHAPVEAVSPRTQGKYTAFQLYANDLLEPNTRLKLEFIEFSNHETLVAQFKFIEDGIKKDGLVKLGGQEVVISTDGQYTNYKIHLLTNAQVKLSPQALAFAQELRDAQALTDG